MVIQLNLLYFLRHLYRKLLKASPILNIHVSLVFLIIPYSFLNINIPVVLILTHLSYQLSNEFLAYDLRKRLEFIYGLVSLVLIGVQHSVASSHCGTKHFITTFPETFVYFLVFPVSPVQQKSYGNKLVVGNTKKYYFPLLFTCLSTDYIGERWHERDTFVVEAQLNEWDNNLNNLELFGKPPLFNY